MDCGKLDKWMQEVMDKKTPDSEQIYFTKLRFESRSAAMDGWLVPFHHGCILNSASISEDNSNDRRRAAWS
jgi:hypothetical protein